MAERMKELKEILNNASKQYYNGQPTMTDKEWDSLYDEYAKLEKETGIILSGSPTRNVGYEIVSKLQKVNHDSRMLSLDKTKDRNALVTFISNQVGLLSWKLDGLTVVLKYNNGKLTSAVTRGNGEIGEDITHNAKCFTNIPLSIDYEYELVVRGEALISRNQFEIINDCVIDENDRYKNPRNLASGTVRQLDSKTVSERKVDFIAFEVVSSTDNTTKNDNLNMLQGLGFGGVEGMAVTKDIVIENIEIFNKNIEDYKYETDGLVLTFNDINFSNSLGTTSKFPKDSIAFKWKDDAVETILIGVEWNTSRTGLINLIALFEPVDIEGSTIERASVHNVSIVRELELGVGDIVTVYKANAIIPQILDNLTRSNTIEILNNCHCCNGKTKIVKNSTCEVLICTNDDCFAKLLGKFVHFCSRDAMNIEGLSEATLEKLINKGFLKTLSDIYYLDQHKSQIVKMDGIGIKSYNNMVKAVENSKNTTMDRLLYGIGIQNIGRTASKTIAKYFNYDWFEFERALVNSFDFSILQDFGDKAQESIFDWYNKISMDNCSSYHDMCRLSLLLNFEKPQVISLNIGNKLNGLIFVITGDVQRYKNRKELQEVIESLGGKVSGSVSAKTSFLINNDTESTSGKNKKAKEVGCKIISEEEFIQIKK